MIVMLVGFQLVSVPSDIAYSWSPVTDGSEMPALELNTDITHAEVVRLPAYEQLEKAPGDRLMIPLLRGGARWRSRSSRPAVYPMAITAGVVTLTEKRTISR